MNARNEFCVRPQEIFARTRTAEMMFTENEIHVVKTSNKVDLYNEITNLLYVESSHLNLNSGTSVSAADDGLDRIT